MHSWSNVCVGRDGLCQRIVRSAHDSGAVLLYGARQAGKTTVLRHIRRRVVESVDSRATTELAVYVDLMTMPHTAGPSEFFGLLVRSLLESCEQQLNVRLPISDEPDTWFYGDVDRTLSAIRASEADRDVRAIFLIDEAKRVLGSRFPHAVRDNLFALLYGESANAGRMSMVFSGAQELYQFAEDDTSPIASRAARQVLVNLDRDGARELIGTFVQCEASALEALTSKVFALTGGQASLTSYFARNARVEGGIVDEGAIDGAVARLIEEHAELFLSWQSKLTDEAKSVHDALLRARRLDVSEAVNAIRAAGLNALAVTRALDELQFSGIATLSSQRVELVNEVYEAAVRLTVLPMESSHDQRIVWTIIEETEVAIRTWITLRYQDKWGPSADAQIGKILGKSAMEQVERNRDKRKKAYPFSSLPSPGILEFLYLGQLGELMTSNQAWDLFAKSFRDKRELEDLIADIMPVRNDRAHFRRVPERELRRCELSCGDLGVIVQNAVNRETPGI